MSAEPWFVDTNALVHVFDDESPRKQRIARNLPDQGADHLVVSTQVLGEFCLTVTRKPARPLATDRAIEAGMPSAPFQSGAS